MLILRIFKESIKFAFNALVVNKLRTILSLLGVTIGIFTIIMVFTIVDSLERNIRNSVSSLGSNVVYVQKWPWGGGGGEYKWWKYFQRPQPSFKEMQELEKRMKTSSSIAFAFGFNKTVKFASNSVENATILPVSHKYYEVWNYDLEEGRYFSELESQNASPVAVIGKDIAEGLFGNINPIGKRFRVLGRKIRVIGVFERQGTSLVGQNTDETVLIPVTFARSMMNVNNRNGALIMVSAKPGVDIVELKDELRGTMRSLRKLKPKAEDDFALNEISVLANGLDSLFGVIGFAGGAIGFFSILVGGFGIANIMFVSVKERTNQIGIQKSLGAKKYFIRLQFLLESTILCVIGGLIGLLLVFLSLEIFYLAYPDLGLEIAISGKNVVQGISLSAIIGLVAGFIPAWQASRLDPVEAIRSGI
tara:strand:- start:45913 stop:47169 length:1257 start_codon:yes stop_codon:yes gene_type:complete